MSKKPDLVPSVSGGKDSTAVLILLKQKKLLHRVADIVVFDTGWEFPQMHEHWQQLEKYIGRRFTYLRPRPEPGYTGGKSPFDWQFSELPIGPKGSDDVKQYGRGWAHPRRRWCTGRKQEALDRHLKSLADHHGVGLPLIKLIGFAADEVHRADQMIAEHEKRSGKTRRSSERFFDVDFPLINYNLTETDALQLCYDAGFYWGGLYEHFDRLSCFCCPLQGIGELKTLRRFYPDMWAKMLEMESWLPEHGHQRRFNGKLTVSDLEKRFTTEDIEEAEAARRPCQMSLFEPEALHA